VTPQSPGGHGGAAAQAACRDSELSDRNAYKSGDEMAEAIIESPSKRSRRQGARHSPRRQSPLFPQAPSQSTTSSSSCSHRLSANSPLLLYQLSPSTLSLSQSVASIVAAPIGSGGSMSGFIHRFSPVNQLIQKGRPTSAYCISQWSVCCCCAVRTCAHHSSSSMCTAWRHASSAGLPSRVTHRS